MTILPAGADNEGSKDERLVRVPDKIISAAHLFEGEKEICIEHAGVRYRLRITRRNRLILQK